QLFGTIHGGESFKGSDAGDQPAMLEYNQYAVTTGNGNTRGLWTTYYDGVSRCNAVLKILPNVTDMSDARKITVEAEARFLRAHYYFYIKRAFKNIPWVDETTEDVRVPNTVDNDGSTYVNIWPNIAADMDFARKNLPATQKDLGRPNKWAADCYYAKILIYRACEGEYANGFTEALAILNTAITSGVTSSGDPYDLLPRYHDNFNCTTENGPEFVWGTQCSANDGTSRGDSNGDPKSVWIQSQSKSGPGLGRGWGFLNPTPFYADMFRVDANGLPYLDFYATNPNRLKDDYGLPAAPAGAVDTFMIDVDPVDPRLDWTISRRGIPCLDYGDFPGASWIRNQSHGGPYMVKKWYIWKSEDGTFTAPGRRNTAMNIPTIRFADVLLMAAECAAQEGQLELARTYVNRVRQRMIDNSDDPMNWVKRADGVTNAANYDIGTYDAGLPNDPFLAKATALDAILYERALELGTEGHRFWDVTRFGEGEYIFNLFINTEKARFDYLSEAVYTDIPDSYHPIPRDAIDRSQKGGVNTLTQNPGY
ncbi:MAG: RagB/SusD family nutrient uptake outer membrane protein, partial [Bacteroidales bacterium]|nr:RagB/SusD family nutrient uptake outer membrane protein [Bacteroidales bacterium]